LHCDEEVPIYAATITNVGVAAAAEVADSFFPVWMDPEKHSVFTAPIQTGFAAAGDKDMMPICLHRWHGCKGQKFLQRLCEKIGFRRCRA
jgi:hypothetical protein